MSLLKKTGLLFGLPAAVVLAYCVSTTGPEEGNRNQAYQDVGAVWTICRGHARDVHAGDYKTDPVCDELFNEDMLGELEFLQDVVTVPVTLPRISALADTSFNIGHKAFKNSTMLRKLNAGDTRGACDELTKSWVYAGRLPDGRKRDCRVKSNGCHGLVDRRERMRERCLRGT
jgi:lysozyme